MDKWQAIHSFWSSFGVPAYEENSVPDDAAFPRITYEAATSVFDSLVSLSASIWVRSTSWTDADALAEAVEYYIKSMGCPVIKGGRYRVFIGDSTFARRMNDPVDDQLKRILLTVTFEFMTI